MLYEELLDELKSFASEKYKTFHSGLLKDESRRVLGVSVPQLKKLAAKYKNNVEELLSFPDDYYEVTFVKLAAVGLCDYYTFIGYADSCVPLISDWALCDSAFDAKCIKAHKDEFLVYIRKYIRGEEFSRRYALVTLLKYYTEEKYLEIIFPLVERCNCQPYYVSMAAAWLIAELLIKFYPQTVGFLSEQSLDKKTHNRAIRKACESYRISNDRKNFLKGIKR